ncbi:MAG: Rrf2 family transcriptional regulator [Bryobacterales bacterium]|nr:Rrf2 family transcriptional regulator [Bryobacterales bacterium]
MYISVKAEYALSAIFDLATQPPGEPVRIADIAKRQNIPQKFLELILSSLKQGGFVESRRGAEGGYLLSRAADSIMVGEVIRFVDGGKAREKRKTGSPFAEMWARVDDAVSSVVDQTSFGDLRRNWQERQSKYIPNWDI